MPKIPIIDPKDMLRYLRSYGCEVIRAKGSHHRILNPSAGKRSTLPIHSGDDLSPGLFVKILKDLGIDINEFIDFIK